MFQITARRMRLVGHVARVAKRRDAYRIVAEKSQEK
jgi:hypothetical protein